MIVINYSDFTNLQGMSALCKTNKVVFDFKLFDIPNTMRRNISTLAKIGGHAVTISDDALNYPGIAEAKQAGLDFGIEIIIGSLNSD